MLLLVGVFSNPVFAEVTSLETNDNSYLKGEKIEFSGTVQNDSTGLVTIVIRDLNDEFVLLSQATIDYDYTFEKSIIVENRFSEYGSYSATGFILNMTEGITTEFDLVSSESVKNQNSKQEITDESDKEEIIENKNNELKNKTSKSSFPEFVDSNKDPSYYVERYYSEPTYKSWFDRNYPNLTIEEAVGYTNNVVEIKTTVQNIIENEIIPEAEASSLVTPTSSDTNNSDIAQISLAIAGLGILFGAVYGVKRQVDNNSRQIRLNKNTIKKKIINPISRTSPLDILKVRLAKGEISVEEFEVLKDKLN